MRPNLTERDPNLSSNQAAAYLGVKPRTLAKWRSSQAYRLPFSKAFGRVVYKLSDLNAFIASGRREGQPA